MRSSERLIINNGQSCFLLGGDEGVRLLSDPVGPEFGYHLPLFSQLDALLISHLHPDHTSTQAVTGGTPNYVGLDSGGHFQAIQPPIKTVAIRSVAAFHDANEGRDQGEAVLGVIDIDGFHVVHLGDLG